MKQLLRNYAIWVLTNIKPTHDELDKILLDAFHECGLDKDKYSLDYELGNKATEFLYHASAKIGNSLRTVNDVKKLLQ